MAWFLDTNACIAHLRGTHQAHDLVELTEEVAQHYARIRAELEKRGLIIGNNDLWIAATTLAHGAHLITSNGGEFSRVPQLSIEDWTQ